MFTHRFLSFLFLTFTFSLLLPLSSQAQRKGKEYNVTVLRKADNSPIPYCKITTRPKSKSRAITDLLGKAYLSLEGSETVNLLFRVFGYEDTTISVQAGQDVFEFVLELKDFTRDEHELVVREATKLIPREDNGGYVITRDDMSRLPYKNIQDMVSTLPGIDQMDVGTTLKSTKFLPQGGNFSNPTYFIDGVRLMDPPPQMH